MERYFQVLRSIDKCDKLGKEGVIALLQKPVEEFGASLNPVMAHLIGLFLDTKGKTNDETFENVKNFFKHVTKVRTRIALMVHLEEKVIDDKGETLWDRLISLRPNDDNTWRDGGRPANIGWALDDILMALNKR